MVIQLFPVPQLISYLTTIALLAQQLILHGILVQMKIHHRAVLLDITSIQMYALFVQLPPPHGLIAMMLQQQLSVFRDFIWIQEIASIVLSRMHFGRLVNRLLLPFLASIPLTLIAMPVLLARILMHHALTATPISLLLNAFSVMINTILQVLHLVLHVKVEFLTVLDVLMMVKEELDASIAVTIMFLLMIIPVLLVEFLLTTVKVVKNMELDKDYAIPVLLDISLQTVAAVFFAQAKLINALIVIKLVDLE